VHVRVCEFVCVCACMRACVKCVFLFSEFDDAVVDWNLFKVHVREEREKERARACLRARNSARGCWYVCPCVYTYECVCIYICVHM